MDNIVGQRELAKLNQAGIAWRLPVRAGREDCPRRAKNARNTVGFTAGVQSGSRYALAALQGQPQACGIWSGADMHVQPGREAR